MGELSVLGLTDTEEGIYRHFLRNPGTTAEDIQLLLHVPLDEIGSALEHLSELGLLHETEGTGTGTDGGPGAISAADPEIAVDRLTDLRLRELHQQLQQVTQSRHLIAGLRAEQSVKEQPDSGRIERLEDLGQIRGRIDDLAFFAREEILSVEPYTELTPANIAHARPLDTRCLRRGVRIRNVVLREALDHPPTVGYLRDLTSLGAQIRVADTIAERLLVYDRRTALVPVDPADTRRGALLAREAGLVANILALFEKIWDQATDLTVLIDERAGAEGGGLSEMEQQVLEAMCHVGKDESGARSLGVSVRTYRRHVADVLRILGATSRAHAALLARERGWV
ncbi:helix-turn-helix transcriptional regulator [Streptomyces europaeiscabiei]|uniref:Helix-turn-helix transcriptional regulator n=1 Tax=Streptomyces europaeiscabiei TaxID=146819 RepID=A0AAJ2PS63_9ACTN|nr:helix-turn-helix transcriptional regulator [Streptomyces europaeiscabiei]MDX3132242.1 helix-turn-helix transcriptional regulator [Streptomyces europaeiscabiei]